jgi:NADH-quinone oxidoreductase subunit M
MLAWTIYISFIGAAAMMLLPGSRPRVARVAALLVAIAGLAIALIGIVQHTPSTEISTITKLDWIPNLGISFHFASDGISLVLVLLTGIAAVCGILFSWNIEHRAKEFFAFYLALIGGVYGVFLSFDLFLLFVFYEIAIIPKYFLIAIWGSTNREYGAMKLALYSFVGSAMVLVGLIATYVVAGANTFDLLELAQFPFPETFQYWAFPLVFVGFAILAGLWPFHTWAPTGHVAAPTAASMLLAGVVMKLGAYGALRVAMTLFPLGLDAWRNVIAVLAVIGIIYGALVAFVQKDFKFVIGYSSVSHMGFVLLGMMTLSQIGLSGAVLQMFSHGIIASLLFAVVGRMVYDRAHTRELSALEGMHLSKVMPFAAVTFVIASVASMGLPGFSGFIAEVQIIIGAWQTFPTLAIIAGIGIVIGVAYTLRVLVKSFFGDAVGTSSASSHLKGVRLCESQRVGFAEVLRVTDPRSSDADAVERAPAITIPEKLGAGILIATTFVIGIYPQLLLDLIMPSLNSPLMQPLWKGGRP